MQIVSHTQTESVEESQRNERQKKISELMTKCPFHANANLLS